MFRCAPPSVLQQLQSPGPVLQGIDQAVAGDAAGRHLGDLSQGSYATKMAMVMGNILWVLCANKITSDLELG